MLDVYRYNTGDLSKRDFKSAVWIRLTKKIAIRRSSRQRLLKKFSCTREKRNCVVFGREFGFKRRFPLLPKVQMLDHF